MDGVNEHRKGPMRVIWEWRGAQRRELSSAEKRLGQAMRFAIRENMYPSSESSYVGSDLISM